MNDFKSDGWDKIKRIKPYQWFCTLLLSICYVCYDFLSPRELFNSRVKRSFGSTLNVAANSAAFISYTELKGDQRKAYVLKGWH